MTTKADRINSAYSQMRISGITLSPSNEDTEVALDRLESMMAELELGRNICMGYNFEEVPDTGSLTNVPRQFWQAIDTNLAIRLIPDFNKQVPQALIAQASQSLSTAAGMSALNNLRQIQSPSRMPLGSGSSNRFGFRQRYNRPVQLPNANCSDNILLVNDIDDYKESFEAYLDSAETIDSFVITADSGLTVVSSSNDDPIISYRIQAGSTATNGAWQQVKIIITTSSGRVDTRLVNFEIKTNKTVNGN